MQLAHRRLWGTNATQPLASIPPFYSRTSFYNRTLGSGDTLASDNSPAGYLANQINYGNASFTFNGYSGIGYGYYNWPGSVFMNSSNFSYPIWSVRNTDTKVKIGLYNSDGTTNTPIGTGDSNLQSFCDAVPIPDKAQCPYITGTSPYVDIWANGSDANIAIWNRDTDEGWEFWRIDNTGPSDMQSAMNCTWTARYGGYIPSVSTFNAIFSNGWGARATGLGAMGGLILMQDIRDVHNGGTINHALCVGVPFSNSSSFVGPAQRTDGPGANSITVIPNGSPGAGGANPALGHDANVEGQRFRFASGVDLSGCTHPMALAMAKAIRDYGLIIVDTAGVVAFYIEDPRTLTSKYHLQGASAPDPLQYTWSDGQTLLNGSALQQIPWSQLKTLNPISS